MKRLICFALVAALTVVSIGCGKANQDFVKEPNIENAQEENIEETELQEKENTQPVTPTPTPPQEEGRQPAPQRSLSVLIDDFNDRELNNPYWYTWGNRAGNGASFEAKTEIMPPGVPANYGYLRVYFGNLTGARTGNLVSPESAPQYAAGIGVWAGKSVDPNNKYLCFKYHNPTGAYSPLFGGVHLSTPLNNDLIRYTDSAIFNSSSIYPFNFNPYRSPYLKIKIIDDDNNNYQNETLPNSYRLLYDDEFIFNGCQKINSSDPDYNQKVSFRFDCHQYVAISLSSFVDANPGIGDDILNPEQINGSGGLLLIQFDYYLNGTNDPNHTIAADIDDIKIIPESEIPEGTLIFD